MFARLDLATFERCLPGWIVTLVSCPMADVVAIDDKVVRRSYSQRVGRGTVDLVGALSLERRLVLGQLAVDDHPNEILVVPTLLNLIAPADATVTVDDTHSQMATAPSSRCRTTRQRTCRCDRLSAAAAASAVSCATSS